MCVVSSAKGYWRNSHCKLTKLKGALKSQILDLQFLFRSLLPPSENTLLERLVPLSQSQDRGDRKCCRVFYCVGSCFYSKDARRKRGLIRFQTQSLKRTVISKVSTLGSDNYCRTKSSAGILYLCVIVCEGVEIETALSH